jgi:arsenate reductase
MTPIRVLFLCTGNSARSLIAESLLKATGGEDYKVFSAGTEPRGLNPLTLEVLNEHKLPTSGLESKNLNHFLDETFDYVVTVCDKAAERCPVFPGAERIHWDFADPAAVEGEYAAKKAAFERTLVEMRGRIDLFRIVAERAEAVR